MRRGQASTEDGADAHLAAGTEAQGIPPHRDSPPDDAGRNDSTPASVVKVHRIQSAGTEYADGDTIIVAVGSKGNTIALTAIPDSGNTWPSVAPTWNDGTEVTDGHASVDWPIVEAGESVVTATCGTSSVTVTILVLDLAVGIRPHISVNQTGITVTATLAGLTPIGGQTISFSSSDLTFSSSTATTDAAGVATVTATASGTPSTGLDAASVTASSGPISATDGFTIVSVGITSASSDSILVGAYTDNSLYTSLLTYTVNPPIAGVPLTFALQSGTGVGYSIAAALENPSASTDASGVGTVRLRSGDLRETATVKCTFGASTATKDVTFTGITGVSCHKKAP